MKPWERDIQEMERYFVKHQEDENMKANTGLYNRMNQLNSNTLVLINQLKEKHTKDIMSQYFNYGFNEETFKTYIN